ncbi:hypothetical protein HanIR_Chr11g0556741 [Helianthus annuus]|nr:hypothetical protein HanIR_Chr11g0556741 [Helianthus annuus]
MKSLFGSPGKINGLVLRTCQCLFAAASLSVMASASSGFSTSTSFWFGLKDKTCKILKG